MADPSTLTKLQSFFLDLAPDKHPSQWDHAWQQDITPWDRSTHQPALEDALLSRTNILGSPFHPDGTRKKALIPGCGKAYDVLLLASFGYDATGLDVSAEAVRLANEMRAAQEERLYPVRDEKVGRGHARVLEGDFFQGEEQFREEVADGGRFDLVFDHTFLCALPAAMRPRWAERMKELLSGEGRLVCVEFPLLKAPSAPGPPFGLEEGLYVELLRRPGRNVQYDDDQSVVVGPGGEEVEEEGALIRVERWKAERAHTGQEGVYVSVWRHK